MDKNDVCAGLVVLMLLLTIFAFAIGLAVGHVITGNEWTDRVKRANIKLVHHETKVDGIVTTNWIEVVHLNK